MTDEIKVVRDPFEVPLMDDTTEDSFHTFDYNPNGTPNSDRAIREAAETGGTVVYPGPHDLFIDLDDDAAFQLFQRLFGIFNKFIGDKNAEFVASPSRSGLPKRHVIVTVYNRTFTELERALYQAVLGSDRVRELLAVVQALNGDPHPTLFIEGGTKPQKALPPAPEDSEVFTVSGTEWVGASDPVEDFSPLTDEDVPF